MSDVPMSDFVEDILRAQQESERMAAGNEAEFRLTDDEKKFVETVLANSKAQGTWHTRASRMEKRRELQISCRLTAGHEVLEAFAEWAEMITVRTEEVEDAQLYAIAYIPQSTYDKGEPEERKELEVEALTLAKKDLEHSAVSLYRGLDV